MSGIQEILLIILLIVAIFLMPRVFSRHSTSRRVGADQNGINLFKRLSGRMRLAVLASLVWPILMIPLIKPWQHQMMTFLYAGFGPVVLCWGVYWVIGGFRKPKT